MSEEREPYFADMDEVHDRDWARAIEFQRLRFIRQVVVAAVGNLQSGGLSVWRQEIDMLTEGAAQAWDKHISPREKGE